jgi:predicted ATP-grasp superfamily ATP-dependent carboligase
MSRPRILIVGGSTRAAADSVRRAGFHPVCADLFADLDLKFNAEVIPVTRYPESLPDDVAQVRADGWFYCGALENHPGILERMLTSHANYGPLLGTPPVALRSVRDPHWLTETLKSEGIPVLEVAPESSPPPPDGTWLQKPLAGAGGRLIRIWDPLSAGEPFPEPHYFQRLASGRRLSALFHVEAGEVEWLGGACELATNIVSQAPSEFAYCGTCGPLKRMPRRCGGSNALPARSGRSLPGLRKNQAFRPGLRNRNLASARVASVQSIERQLTRIARTLVRHAPGLRGLVGLDFRCDGDNIRLVEVNPRYTAALEVLELASGQSLFAGRDRMERPVGDASTVAGIAGSGHGSPARSQFVDEPRRLIVSKRILYAACPMVIPDLTRFIVSNNPWQIPLIADIPCPGSLIQPGWPICTVLAGATTLPALTKSMRCRLDLVQTAIRADS